MSPEHSRFILKCLSCETSLYGDNKFKGVIVRSPEMSRFTVGQEIGETCRSWRVLTKEELFSFNES